MQEQNYRLDLHRLGSDFSWSKMVNLIPFICSPCSPGCLPHISPCPGQETIWSFWNWLISFTAVFTQPPLSDPSLLPSNSWPLANLVRALAIPEDFSSRTYLGKTSTQSPALRSPALRFPSPERIFSRRTLSRAQGRERRAECRWPRRDRPWGPREPWTGREAAPAASRLLVSRGLAAAPTPLLDAI